VHRPALFLLLAVFVSPLARAQEPKDKMACFDYRKDNAPYKKHLWDGYEISLGPSRNPDAVEDKCTGAIYNSAGKVVFRTSGFSVVFGSELSPEDLKKLDQADERGSDAENVVSALESRTLQHVFCHEFDEALKDLNLWPADQREMVMKSFAEGIAEGYPEFAARLRGILKGK
jgi:hypothetical protein